MKKFYMTMVAMLFGVAAMAQENYLYIEDFSGNAGEKVDLAVKLHNDDPITAVSFRLGLPEGVTMATNNKGKKYVTIDEDRMEDHTSILQTATDGADMISVYDPNTAPFYENDGTVVTVPLQIAESVVDGTYDVRIYECSCSDPDNVEKRTKKEYTATLTVGNGDGINGINADDAKAPVYNLSGQRVNKAQQGVFIQNGKKVAVK